MYVFTGILGLFSIFVSLPASFFFLSNFGSLFTRRAKRTECLCSLLFGGCEGGYIMELNGNDRLKNSTTMPIKNSSHLTNTQYWDKC